MTEEEKKQQKELWKQDRIRARREEWKKIKSMGTGAKLQYLWDYYKIVLAIAIGLAFTAYLIVTIIQGSRMSTILYTCFLNVDELDPDTETLREDYIRARGGTKKTENITFDSSVVVNPDSTGTTQQDVAASIKITSYTGAGALDVFLAPPNVTEYEQENGMLLKLDDILTKEEIEELGDAGYLYYKAEPETDRLSGALVQTELSGKDANSQNAGEKGETAKDDSAGGTLDQEEEYSLNTRPEDGMHIYAVRIDPSGVIGQYDIYDADTQVWFSVIGNTSRREEAARFLRFLLGETQYSTEEGVDASHT